MGRGKRESSRGPVRGGERARPASPRSSSGGDRYESRGGSDSRERRGERSFAKPTPRFGSRPEGRFSRPERGDRPERGERFERRGGRDERRPEDRRAEGRRPEAAPRTPRPGGDRGRFGSSSRDSSSRYGRPTSSRPTSSRDSGSRYGRPERYGEPRFSERGPVGGSEAPSSGASESFGSDTPPDLIWGRHSAQAALESGRPIHRIWCTPEMRFSPRFLQLLREAKAGGVLVEEVTWARLGQITGGAVHQGIVLQTAAADTLDLPSLIEGCRGIGEPPLLMALDGITDPHNLGAIARSAEALGAHGLVLPQRRSAGLTGSVAKVAAGALEHLPVARVVNLNRALDALKQEGYRVVGLASEGSVTLEEADLDGPLVIVTGSEGEGLSMLTRRSCDQVVRIPLRGATPSLNASVATALMLYEVARRGWMQKVLGSSPAPRIVRPSLPSPAAAAVVSEEPEQAGSVEDELDAELLNIPAEEMEEEIGEEFADEFGAASFAEDLAQEAAGTEEAAGAEEAEGSDGPEAALEVDAAAAESEAWREGEARPQPEATAETGEAEPEAPTERPTASAAGEVTVATPDWGAAPYGSASFEGDIRL